jgi:hypothetical protein
MTADGVTFGEKDIMKKASRSRTLGSAQVPGNSPGQVFGDEWSSRAKAPISEKALCD